MLAAVIGAVGLIVKGLSHNIEKFTINLEDVGKRIAEVEVEMIKDFALKEELVPIRARIAELLSREDMALLRSQIQQIATDVSTLMARADLNRRSGEQR